MQIKTYLYSVLAMALLTQVSCISSSVRFPSSHEEIYKFSELKQDLLLAAQNNVLFHIPQETLFEVEKTVVDSRCQDNQKPFWSEKLSSYLNLMRSHPEWFAKFHVIEIKKGDTPKVIIEKDLDEASVLSIQYVKSESRGQVSLKTNLPCSSQRVAEYLGKDIIKTQFDFPSMNDVSQVLISAHERKQVKRFDFSNTFLSYLAERGFILKFSHDLSFERNSENKFVMSEILNKLGQEVVKSKENNKHVHLWMKILNDIHKTDDIVQFFSIENQAGLKSGIKFTTNENSSFMDQKESKYFTTQLYLTYKVENETIQSSDISDLEDCLAQISNQKTKLFMRQPTSEIFSENRNLKEYSCLSRLNPVPVAPVQEIEHD